MGVELRGREAKRGEVDRYEEELRVTNSTKQFIGIGYCLFRSDVENIVHM